MLDEIVYRNASIFLEFEIPHTQLSMSTKSLNFEAFYWNILSSINLIFLISTIQKLMTLHDLLRIISGNKKILFLFSNVHLGLHLQKTRENDFMEFFKDQIFHHKKCQSIFFLLDFFLVFYDYEICVYGTFVLAQTSYIATFNTVFFVPEKKDIPQQS